MVNLNLGGTDMKVLIIGTNHAGIAVANTLLDNYPGNEVVMIDRNTNLSYLAVVLHFG